MSALMRGLAAAVLAGLGVSACATAPSEDPYFQLRSQVEFRMQQAGVSRDCILSLDRVALTQAKAVTDRSRGGLMGPLRDDQRLRKIAADHCGGARAAALADRRRIAGATLS